MRLWDTYALPDVKRNHSRLVARLAVWFAGRLSVTEPGIRRDLVEVAALLHDIDKAAPTLPGERHPDAGVRILTVEGMGEVARVVRTHPLHAILDPAIAPSSWEEKLVYLSDKMVKHTIITVDERFALWRAEHLPADAVEILDRTYPLVKALEADVFGRIGVRPSEAASLASPGETGTIKAD